MRVLSGSDTASKSKSDSESGTQEVGGRGGFHEWGFGFHEWVFAGWSFSLPNLYFRVAPRGHLWRCSAVSLLSLSFLLLSHTIDVANGFKPQASSFTQPPTTTTTTINTKVGTVFSHKSTDMDIDGFADVRQHVGDEEAAAEMRYDIFVLSEPSSSSPSCETLLRRMWELSGGYIWHEMGPNLQPAGSIAGKAHYTGTLRYGEGVDDEWMLLAVLRQLSVSIKGIAVRAVDGDGQFMLIEAAEVLPDWMDPAGMDNRVFIRDGHLVVLPTVASTPAQMFSMSKFPQKPMKCSDDCPELDLDVAVGILSLSNAMDFRDVATESEVWARLGELPGRGLESQTHVVDMELPTPVACALQQCPQLFSRCVAVLHGAPSGALKFMKSMPDFSPQTCGTSTFSVRYTKTQHAMLSQSAYTPSAKHFVGDASKARRLGAKLASGFQGAYSVARLASKETHMAAVEKTEPADTAQTAETAKPLNAMHTAQGAFDAELRRTQQERARAAAKRSKDPPTWERYKARLVSLGYFRGEIEGSQLWQEKETAAREQFSRTQHSSEETQPTPPPTEKPKRTLPSWHPSAKKVEISDQNCFVDGVLKPFDSLVADAVCGWYMQNGEPEEFPKTVEFALEKNDGEEWMNIEEKDFEAQLGGQFNANLSEEMAQDASKKAARASSAASFQQSQSDLADALSKLPGFLSEESSHKGVEVETAKSQQTEKQTTPKTLDDEFMPPLTTEWYGKKTRFRFKILTLLEYICIHLQDE